MQIKLTRKLAECLDGVDVSACREGDVLDLPDRDARVLMAEGWAVPLKQPSGTEGTTPYATSADCRRQIIEHAERLRKQIERPSQDTQERRRREDVIRDELHDSRGHTIRGRTDDGR